jgi:hypothetical protein
VPPYRSTATSQLSMASKVQSTRHIPTVASYPKNRVSEPVARPPPDRPPPSTPPSISPFTRSPSPGSTSDCAQAPPAACPDRPWVDT